MEEQIVSEPAARRTVPLFVLVFIAVAAGIAALAIWRVLSGSGDPAAFIPKDVAMAVTVNVRGSAGKDAAIKYIEGVLKQAGLNDPENQLLRELSGEARIDFSRDVIPKLSGIGAGAVLDDSYGFQPEMVAVIGARDREDASSLLTLIGVKLNEQQIRFRRLEYEGRDYYGVSRGSASYFAGPNECFVGAAKSAMALFELRGRLQEGGPIP